MSCSHAGAVKTRRPRTDGANAGCEECLKMGEHYHATKHPIITSLEPGETWSWCYVDEEALEIP